MINLTLKIALIVMTLIYIYVILRSIKKGKMQIAFSLFWLISGIVLIIALLIPNFIEVVSNSLGFETPSNMIFCITIFIAFWLIFNLMLELSKQYRRNVNLVQEVSLIKRRLEKLEKKLKQDN